VKSLESEAYAVPEVVATYSTRQLLDEAAGCQGYQRSDAALKDDVEIIREPLGGLSRIETTR
jgi:hypothetical protein